MVAKHSKSVSKKKTSVTKVSPTPVSTPTSSPLPFKPKSPSPAPKPSTVAVPAEPVKRRECGFDLDQNCTVFVRNLPYGSTVQDLQQSMLTADSTLKIERIYLVKDATGQPRGTAFIKLASSSDAARLIELGKPRTNRSDELASFLGKTAESTVVLEGLSSGITLNGRLLYFLPAERPAQVVTLKKERESHDNDQKNKSRNMHLLTEGHIAKDDAAYAGLTASEKRQREDSFKERQYKMSNPNFFVSDLRVSFRNLPLAVDNKSLRSFIELALCSTTTKTGGESTKTGGKAELAIARSIIKTNVIVDKDNNNRSKGFGFAEFRDHQTALLCVRTMNNRPDLLGAENKRSPIVEFTIEDKRKLKILEAAKARHRTGAKNASKRNNYDQ